MELKFRPGPPPSRAIGETMDAAIKRFSGLTADHVRKAPAGIADRRSREAAEAAVRAPAAR